MDRLNTPEKRPPHTSRIPSLDGLRAFSIALVICGHMAGTVGAPRWLFYLEPYANFGVRIFFVISGFLITTLLLTEHERTGTISLKQFYRRRIYRIFPAAYAYVTVIAMLAWTHLRAKDLVVAYSYLSNYHLSRPWLLGHLWSLSVEEQFYLLWPAVVLLCFRRRRSIALAVVLFAPISRVIFWKLGMLDGVGNYFPTVADSLATGCLLAMYQPELTRWADRIYRPVFVLVPLIALAIPSLPLRLRIDYTLGAAVMNTAIALSIDACVRKRFWILNWRPVAWIGVLSYSLYLWQQPFINRNAGAIWNRVPWNIGCALLAATASYYFVERPMLRLREKPAPRKAHASAAAQAAGSLVQS